MDKFRWFQLVREVVPKLVQVVHRFPYPVVLSDVGAEGADDLKGLGEGQLRLPDRRIVVGDGFEVCAEHVLVQEVSLQNCRGRVTRLGSDCLKESVGKVLGHRVSPAG